MPTLLEVLLPESIMYGEFTLYLDGNPVHPSGYYRQKLQFLLHIEKYPNKQGDCQKKGENSNQMKKSNN